MASCRLLDYGNAICGVLCRKQNGICFDKTAETYNQHHVRYALLGIVIMHYSHVFWREFLCNMGNIWDNCSWFRNSSPSFYSIQKETEKEALLS